MSVDAPNLGGVDPAAQTNTTVVDAKGRTVAVWNADNVPSFSDNSGTTSATPSIAFALDGFGRMRTTTLRGQTQTIAATYDALGRQTELNDPDKGDWHYVNNALGQVVSQTDAKGSVTLSSFDRLGRPLTRQTTESGSGPVETANYYYYDTGNLNNKPQTLDKGTKGWIGAPAREEASTTGAPGYTDQGTKSVHYYDAKGRPNIDLTTIDGKWFYTYTDYDDYSRVSGVRHFWRPPAHESPGDLPYLWSDFGYTYTYDTKSYLLSLQDSTGPTWWQADSNTGYDYLDRPVLVRRGNGYWTSRTYRPEDGVLTGISTGNGNVQNLSFGFDGLGNLTSRGDSLHNRSENFTYDALNRLTGSSITGAVSYFDNGNIRNKTSVSGATTGDYTYDTVHPHAAAAAFGYAMTYDANGNLATRAKTGETWDMRWAGFDKPRWMTKTAGSTVAGSEFHYNAARSRVMHLDFDAMSGGAPSHYTLKRLYALGSTVEIDYKNSSTTGQSWNLDKVRIYVPGPDGIVGTMEFASSSRDKKVESNPSIERDLPSERMLVYHYDHLGSIESITPYGDTSGNYASDEDGRTGRYSYEAWGQRRNAASWSGVPADTAHGGKTDLTPRGYTGHEMLDDLGLVHMNGRIYDPLLGRFLSADLLVQHPASLQAYNRYSYVGNNPLTITDPSGFQATPPVPEMAEPPFRPSLLVDQAGEAVQRLTEAIGRSEDPSTLERLAGRRDRAFERADIPLRGDPRGGRGPEYTELTAQGRASSPAQFAANRAMAKAREIGVELENVLKLSDAKVDPKPTDGKIRSNDGVTNPNGRNGTPEHQTDVAKNNRQESGDLTPQQVGNRVPDGVGQTGQVATVRGQSIDPGETGRVIVESDKVNQNGQINSAGRGQIRDIRSADPAATIVVTDHTKPNSPPIVYRPGSQPPPKGRLPKDTPTAVEYP